MKTYELSSSTDYWGQDVNEDVAYDAAKIGKRDIEETFAGEITVRIVPSDAHNDTDDEQMMNVFAYVQDRWVSWLADADLLQADRAYDDAALGAEEE